MRVFLINGKPRSGKDTFIEMCREIAGVHYVQALSFVDAPKEIARKCGWNGQKDPKSRKFLADLTDLLTEYNDYPFQSTLKDVIFYRDYYKMYDVEDRSTVFICARETSVIDRFKEEFGNYNIEALSILVRNNRTESVEASNRADANVLGDGYVYDIIIDNNGSMNELHDEAVKFCEQYILEV